MPSDEVQIPLRPITRARTKKLREALQRLVRDIQSQEVVPKTIEALEQDELKFVHIIQVKEEVDGSVSGSFGFISIESL